MQALTVNGVEHELDVPEEAPLLYVLRDHLGLNGPKYGCGVAQCGACAVLIGGSKAIACATPVSAAAGQEVVTLEGLGSITAPHPLQRAFIEEQAAQCGYCINGMIIAAKALLDQTPKPSEAEVRTVLDGHLCRCGTHNRILRAVMRAAGDA